MKSLRYKWQVLEEFVNWEFVFKENIEKYKVSDDLLKLLQANDIVYLWSYTDREYIQTYDPKMKNIYL